ncbi:hypothetical protein GCM10010389_66070 [Streptomyces echinoruber]|uniref:Uncharacterized protein n=1 Tax=Streptomyces echinoruber TaxID=68898 RepID=A0A918S1M8_9ACTN|nr:hypothetical protein GCM10010389_66070 [Streptomyces echinoruber]
MEGKAGAAEAAVDYVRAVLDLLRTATVSVQGEPADDSGPAQPLRPCADLTPRHLVRYLRAVTGPGVDTGLLNVR